MSTSSDDNVKPWATPKRIQCEYVPCKQAFEISVSGKNGAYIQLMIDDRCIQGVDEQVMRDAAVAAWQVLFENKPLILRLSERIRWYYIATKDKIRHKIYGYILSKVIKESRW